MTTALAMVGARTSAQTAGEARNAARAAEMERRGLEGAFNDLGADVRREIDATPEVAAAQEDVTEQSRERQSDFQAYKDERQEIDDRYDGRIAEAAERLGAGRQFREVYSEHQGDRALEKDRLRIRSVETLAFIDDLDPRTAEFDRALNAYMEAVSDPALEDEALNEFNFELRDENLQRLVVNRFGAGMLERLEAFFRENDHPLVRQLKDDRELLRPYWDVGNDFRERFAQELTPEALGIWDEYREAPPRSQERRQVRERASSLIARLERAQKNIRDGLLFDDSALERALLRWEYFTVPRTIEGRQFIEETFPRPERITPQAPTRRRRGRSLTPEATPTPERKRGRSLVAP